MVDLTFIIMGFSAGIVAGFLLPIFNMITDNNNQKKNEYPKETYEFLKKLYKKI